MILPTVRGSKAEPAPLEFLSFVPPNHSHSTEDEVRSRMLARKNTDMSFEMQTKHFDDTNFLPSDYPTCYLKYRIIHIMIIVVL